MAASSWLTAVRAAEAKQATDIVVLDLTGITAFADYFVICTGGNSKQVQAISDEIGLQLKHQAGELPTNIEGHAQAEWVLSDYGDLLIHIFTPITSFSTPPMIRWRKSSRPCSSGN